MGLKINLHFNHKEPSMKLMKNFLGLLAFLMSVNVVAADIPFWPESDARFKGLEGFQAPYKAKHLARGVWDPSSDSNAGSSTVNSGVHNIGAQLPAGAIITNSYFYVATLPVSTTGGDATVNFKCEDASNILAATEVQGWAAGQIRAGKQAGASTLAGGLIPTYTDSIAANCDLAATVATRSYSAGKIYVFVEFVVGL